MGGGKTDNGALEQQVQEIHDAILGTGYHKGDGIIDRLVKLEAFRSAMRTKIAFVSGFSSFAGVIIGILIKDLLQ